ncbi:MAG: transcriptional activator NhaR [Proteobacteria bacterium]|nr:transcriptional activator NhaR [Pseudomonadota bacterium]
MANIINYKHLHYFWTVAREGSIAGASKTLHITPQTISGQLTMLEESVGEKLFRRQGRGLTLSEKGRLVFRYADEIFNLGKELQDVIRGASPVGQLEFAVGILDCIPKTIAYKLLTPGLQTGFDISITCKEGPIDHILSELAVHKLDMVLADMPLTSSYNIKAYNHFLGESGITFFAKPEMSKQFSKNFPKSLNNAPILIPTENSTIRRAIDQWFDELEVYPKIMGEFDDSALLKAFGQGGVGIFFMPTVIEKDICKQFNVNIIGRTAKVKEQFYAISTERKIKHPAIASICKAAKQKIDWQ